MEITYGWKVGSCIHTDAKKTWEEWETLGEIKTPEMILNYASTHKKSETYKYYDKNNLWDDKHAAHLKRLDVAGHLLRSIVIIKEETDRSGEIQNVSIRLLESVKNENEEIEASRVYISTEKALQNPETRERLISEIKSGLNSYKEKAMQYSTLIKNPELFNKGLEEAIKAL